VIAFKLSLSAGELALRVRDRLRGNALASATKVTWQKPDGQRVLIDLATLGAKVVDGWFVCSVDAQTDQTGRATLQFVFFLGRPKEADGIKAAGTINAPTLAAAQIAAVWGADMQRVIWDAVLDVLEASLWQAGNLKPGERVTLQGFHAIPNVLNTEVIVGKI
jgi:hypothetical protein